MGATYKRALSEVNKEAEHYIDAHSEDVTQGEVRDDLVYQDIEKPPEGDVCHEGLVPLPFFGT